MVSVIGSCALKINLGTFRHTVNGRIPKDMDLIASHREVMDMTRGFKIEAFYPTDGGKKIVTRYASRAGFKSTIKEIELTWPGSTAEKLNNLIIADKSTIYKEHQNIKWAIASMDVLYMLKMTHRFKKDSPHFLKTMSDIKFMRNLGAKIRDEHQEFYELRTAETYPYAHPKLNVTKSNFFTSNVNYVYDHDSIHVAMKHLGKPAYSFFKPNDQEVLTSKTMFDRQPEIIKKYAVLEEAYVLALERSQVPHGRNVVPLESFKIALEKICTSITSGWFREYAWEHYDEVMGLYDPNYVDKFWDKVHEGIVTKHKG